MAMSDTKSMKTQRSSVLPTNLQTFGRLGCIAEWYFWLWQQAPLKLDPADTDLLRVYASLIIDSAIPHVAALDCLTCLHALPATRPYGSVSIPICRGDCTSRGIELSFSETTSRAIGYWLEREGGSQLKLNLKMPEGARELEQLLTSGFAKTQAVWNGGTAIEFRDIQVLGPLIAIRNGAEPYLISVLNSKVKPTSQSPNDQYGLNDVTREYWSHLFRQHAGSTLRSESIRKDREGVSPPVDEPPRDWIGQSRKLLRNLCCELAVARKYKLRTPLQRQKAMEIIEQYRSRANTIAPADSALLLALEYVIDRYVDHPTINARSLRNYLDRAVINGLLDSEASFSLSDWDSDNFIENIEDRVSDPRLSANSRGQILDAYASLLKFLRKRLKLPPIEMAGLREDYVAGSGQWAVISPHAIDKVIRSLFESGEYEPRQAAVVIALAYYGGLRASETRHLTLADVVFNERLKDLDIELLRGKTANARRRLPLEKLAPSHILQVIRDYWNERRAEFPESARLSKIAFFGPKGQRDRYLHESITRLAREVLKEAFGESSNLHILRHCFCTFLFMRWYAIRHPDFLYDVRDRSHAIFQPKMMARLSDFFAVMPEEDGEIRPYDLVSMTKLTGHASPETLFQFYVHSFSVVQAHAVRNIKSPVSGAVMSDALRRALVPRRRSSSSRARDNQRHL
jgi:integrase